MSIQRISIGNLTLELEGELGSFHASLETRDVAGQSAGVTEVVLELRSERNARPPRIELRLRAPILDLCVLWHPDSGQMKKLPPHWSRSSMSSATQ